ncbi:hypothetical protein HPP92_016077 [Vanilla planifolia]|uniref:Uncharacterized protein n=1 Tax=Vanilla planifolia TaxID=51239 RepID=A0A835QE43_VANPL|nr:hypothetical protein HPP92_016077 [Vanilla planifolia]
MTCTRRGSTMEMKKAIRLLVFVFLLLLSFREMAPRAEAKYCQKREHHGDEEGNSFARLRLSSPAVFPGDGAPRRGEVLPGEENIWALLDRSLLPKEMRQPRLCTRQLPRPPPTMHLPKVLLAAEKACMQTMEISSVMYMWLK